MGLEKLWTADRVERVLAALVVAITVALLTTWYSDTAGTSSLKRGDFPAFYAAAVLAPSGSLERLYSPSEQAAVQAAAWDSLDTTYLSFAYPPYMALLLAPLGTMEPLPSKMLFFLISVVVLAAACAATARATGRTPATILALALVCAPLLSGISAGQNIAFSLALYSLTVLALLRRRHLLAGLAAGLLLFKPNFGLIIIAALALGGSARCLAGAIVAAFFYEGIAQVAFGSRWLSAWIEAARVFAMRDYQANSHQMVSLAGLIEALAPGALFSATPNGLAIFVCLAVFATAGLAAVAVLRRAPKDQRIISAALLAGPLAVVVSPHTMYYDIPLALFPLAFCLGSSPPAEERWQVLLLLLLVAICTTLREQLPAQPMALIALASVFWVSRLLLRNSGRLSLDGSDNRLPIKA